MLIKATSNIYTKLFGLDLVVTAVALAALELSRSNHSLLGQANIPSILTLLFFMSLYYLNIKNDYKVLYPVLKTLATLALASYWSNKGILFDTPSLAWIICVPLTTHIFITNQPLKTLMIICGLIILLVNVFFDTSNQHVATSYSSSTTSWLLFTFLYIFLNTYFVSFIENNKHKKLLFMAETDPLTGILNRRAFEKIIEKRFNSNNTLAGGFSIAMLDIDGFKQINDTFGHSVGDEVLKMVSNTLSKTLRSSDVIARYGGEEFVILFDEIKQKELDILLNRILCSVRQSTLKNFDRMINITVSGGAIYLPQGKNRSYKDVLNLADKKMYEAKRLGKDNIICTQG